MLQSLVSASQVSLKVRPLNASASTLMWETLELFPVLEMLVHIQTLVFPTISGMECEQRETLVQSLMTLSI